MPGEFDLIRRFFSHPGAAPGVVVGIGDDAAVLRVPDGCDLVAAVDTIVESRHFPAGSDPRSIGHRALAVNLSDLAAMGAQPAWATLALTLPSADEAWLEGFAAGLAALARRHGVTLVGGDTTRGPLTVSIQIMGFVPRGGALLRSGARAGDLLAVTGTLGDAGAGLALAQAGGDARAATADAAALELLRRFEYPTPRVEMGLAARGIATAAMDLSDGIAGDLVKFAAASGLAAHVDVDRLPLSAALGSRESAALARDRALCAGDDYELMFAVPAARAAALAAAAEALELRLTVIGSFAPGRDVTWSSNGGAFTPAGGGFDHFA